MSRQFRQPDWMSSLVSSFRRLGAGLHELMNSDFSQRRGLQLSKQIKRPGWMTSLIDFFKRLDAWLHELTVVLVSIMLTVTKIAIFVRWALTLHS
jgi:hypothetical protein